MLCNCRDRNDLCHSILQKHLFSNKIVSYCALPAAQTIAQLRSIDALWAPEQICCSNPHFSIFSTKCFPLSTRVGSDTEWVQRVGFLIANHSKHFTSFCLTPQVLCPLVVPSPLSVPLSPGVAWGLSPQPLLALAPSSGRAKAPAS